MGKPSKKANDQVAVSPVSVPEKKSAKKGKREAKEALEKAISAKKQKVEVETKKVKAPPPKKEEESSSSEEDELSESEEEEPVATKKTNGTKAAVQKKMELNDDSDSADEDDEEDESSDEESLQKQTKAPASGVTKEESSDEEEDDSSDEEEPKKAEQKKSGAKDESDSEEDDESEDEEESEDEKPTKTPKKDVVMKDAPAGKAKSDKKEPKTPVGNQNESGTTTIFVGNLPFKADEDEIASFFSEAGEVVQVRLATNEEGRPRGFGHVEFATEEAAKKALEMNQQEFMGRELRLDLANSRGSSTPHTKDNSSNQKGGKTAFVKGFDTSLGEDEIRTKLQEHFDSCGELTRVSIPTDRETGAIRGIAYMDFKDGGAFAKAFELNGSELDGCVLTVDEAQPRGDGGGRSGGRSGGRGGRFSGGRGGRGGDFGGRGGGGRGRGGRGGGRGRGRKSFGDY